MTGRGTSGSSLFVILPRRRLNIYIANDYNLVEIYLQISPIFLAIVLEHLRYTLLCY